MRLQTKGSSFLENTLRAWFLFKPFKPWEFVLQFLQHDKIRSLHVKSDCNNLISVEFHVLNFDLS